MQIDAAGAGTNGSGAPTADHATPSGPPRTGIGAPMPPIPCEGDAAPRLADGLAAVCRWLESRLDRAACAVLLGDGHDGAARVVAASPRFPDAASVLAAARALLPARSHAGAGVPAIAVIDLAGRAEASSVWPIGLAGIRALWALPFGDAAERDAGPGMLVVLRENERPPAEAEAAALRDAAVLAALAVRGTRATAAAAEVETRYAALVDQLPGIVYIEHLEGDADFFISDAAETILGYAAADLVAGNPSWISLIHPDDDDRVEQAARRSDADGGPFDEVYRMVARDGGVVWIRNQAVLVRAEDGTPLYWHGVAIDLTRQRQAEERLAHLAHHDALTGLPNRALFAERLAAAMARARDGGDAVAVLFIDLDGFKNLNDGLGHDVGDRVLTEASSRLRARLRPADTLARFGGDEFVALLDGVSGVAEAAAIADDLLAALQPPLVVDGCVTHVTGSVGVAITDDGTTDPADLLRQADVALYEAKAAGRAARAVYAPALALPVLARERWETDLRQAVARGDLLLHYQPEVDLSTGRIARLEALVRWLHPRLGLLHPANFVRLAEETGLIVPLGRWVLREACRQVRAWQDATGQPLGVCVNMSAREFCQVSLVDDIAQVLAEAGLAASALELHIAETTAAVASRDTVRRLRELGVRVVIDDFGKAYPTLGGLQDLEFDGLRIDRSFVAGLGADRRSHALVRAIASLGHDSEMAVAAKGIETDDQVAILRQLGIDFGQGFALAPPMEAAAVGELLASGVGASGEPGDGA